MLVVTLIHQSLRIDPARLAAARAGSDAMHLSLVEQHAPPLFESEVPAVEFKRLEARTRKATPLNRARRHG
jgi:hypothetical protein